MIYIHFLPHQDYIVTTVNSLGLGPQWDFGPLELFCKVIIGKSWPSLNAISQNMDHAVSLAFTTKLTIFLP